MEHFDNICNASNTENATEVQPNNTFSLKTFKLVCTYLGVSLRETHEQQQHQNTFGECVFICRKLDAKFTVEYLHTKKSVKNLYLYNN